jgi:choline-sulfatase
VRACAWVALAISALAQDAGRPNVLLITVEALRADRVTTALTPTLAAIAARGTRFTRAYTHAPLTLPAHASLLTGLFPPAHGVRNNGFRLDDLVVTLPELLRDSGYRTGAFIGGPALDARFGLAQGFDAYDDRYEPLRGPSSPVTFRSGAREAAAVLFATSSWIAQQPEPWFAWAHLGDPGAPNVSYDGAVANADKALAAFIGSLATRGVLDRTVIIATADHGAALGEHGERTHGVFAYEATLRVPLAIAGPGVPAREVREPVSHADVMPTMLHLLGVTAPASDGQSLVLAMRGEALAERPIYFEALDAALMRGGAPLTGVVSGQWKFIDLPVAELYDVLADPGERFNRASTESAIATRLRDATVLRRTASPRADAAGTLAEPAARARLRSLGYVGSASWRLGASRVEDDPKRLLSLHLAYEAALDVAGTDPEGALRQLRLIVGERPDFAAAIDAMGALLIAQGRTKEAVALLNEARVGGLRHRAVSERLAAALLAAKNPRGAIAVLEPVVEAEDAAVDARFLLARAYAAVGQASAAVTQLEAALRIDPTFDAASSLLARLSDRRW